MRILGFSKKDWINYQTGIPKLEEGEFTTFRFPRRDKDWGVGEVAQVVYKPRSKEREVLGIAEIIDKQPRNMVKLLDIIGAGHSIPTVTEGEARSDGFKDYWDMWGWLFDTYRGGQRFIDEPMNKLTLRWRNNGHHTNRMG